MKRIICLLILFLCTSIHAQEPIDQPTAEELYLNNLQYQRQQQQLTQTLEEYRIKLEIARILKEAMGTGLVDKQGNLTPLRPGYRPTQPASPLAPGTATSQMQILDNEQAGVPILAAVHGRKGIFSTPQGLVEAKVGDTLPGGFVLKKLSIHQALFERGNERFLAKINWPKKAPSPATAAPAPPAAAPEPATPEPPPGPVDLEPSE